jgi:hypothetical protein
MTRCFLCRQEVAKGGLWRGHIDGRCTVLEPSEGMAKYIQALQEEFEAFKSRYP